MTEQEHMHQCLVRHVIRWRIKDEKAAKAFLARWMGKRPDSTLQRDVVRQWNLKNRGEQGDWRGTNE